MQRKETVREKLKGLEKNRKYTFYGTFSRFGIDRRDPEKETILLLDIYVDLNGKKEYLTDHVWVVKSKRWNRILDQLKEGTKLTFLAEVVEYYKEGRKNYFIDHGLKSVRSVNPITD